MSVFLVIKVLKVDYSPLAAQTVTAAFDGGAPARVPATKPAGTFEVMLPAGVTRITIHVANSGFWDADQGFTLNPGPTPTLSFIGNQTVNIRNVDAHTRGKDHNVEVFVVLGQLRDAAKQPSIAATFNPLLPFKPQSVPSVATPILDPKGTGPATINATVSSITPGGKMFFAERVDAPKLIGIYRPARFGIHPTENPQDSPLDYHLFFHPTIKPDSFPPSAPYPFDPSTYLNLIVRYMFSPLLKAPATPMPGIFDLIDSWGKQMIYQHEAAGQKAIFLFPVGGLTQQMGTLNSQANTLRLLQEVNYWIQRMDGVPFPLQPVGKLAMSCFSAGVRFLQPILNGRRIPSFHDRKLSEIYLFDPVFAANLHKGMTPEQKRRALEDAAKERVAFNRGLVAWWRRGNSGRSFRLYTQSAAWRGDLHPFQVSPTETLAAGARESEDAHSTILLSPPAFWKTIGSLSEVHQYIPAFFMEHAISLNAF